MMSGLGTGSFPTLVSGLGTGFFSDIATKGALLCDCVHLGIYESLKYMRL